MGAAWPLAKPPPWIQTKASGRVAYPTNVLTPNAALAAALAFKGVTVGANNKTISDNESSDARDRNSGVEQQVLALPDPS